MGGRSTDEGAAEPSTSVEGSLPRVGVSLQGRQARGLQQGYPPALRQGSRAESKSEQAQGDGLWQSNWG